MSHSAQRCAGRLGNGIDQYGRAHAAPFGAMTVVRGRGKYMESVCELVGRCVQWVMNWVSGSGWVMGVEC